MSDDYAPELEGQRRAEALRAHLEASAAGSTDVSMQSHKPVSDRLRAGQHGIFGAADSPYEQGAAVAARAATVGGEWGHARAIERHGAPTHHLEGPALPQADRRPRGQTGPDPDAMSPTMRWLRGEQ
jgi:hypothetical protein